MSNIKSNKYLVYHSELPMIPKDFQFIELSKIKKIKKAKEILILDLLDFFDTTQKVQTLKEISSCLTKDGELFIQGTDIYSLSSAVINNQIDTQTYNNLVFSPSKKGISTMGSMLSIVKEADLLLLEAKFINGIQYYIKCGKNDSQK